ncbi:MAG: TetR/AcrR family transcriptional regulator [Alphaproteobacteria bacterium]|nr:TetR/AcrR family transcriptional regulator [Alphaproteobacteria bacterium]
MYKQVKSTRERIVSAAAKLFYGEGIRSVSVDAVAEKAGVTKRTLYYHFRSKDDLVAAYLASRDQPTLALYERWFDESDGPVGDKIKAMFDGFARAATSPKWKGCGFMRTTAELASTPGHPAVKAGASHKKRFEAWLAGRLAGEGVGEPESAARKIVVLLDGAASVMLIHRDPDYIRQAGAVAADLVAAKPIDPSSEVWE